MSRSALETLPTISQTMSQRFTDATINNVGNSGGYRLPSWKLICNDKKMLEKNTKKNLPTRNRSEIVLFALKQAQALLDLKFLANLKGQLFITLV